MTGGVPLPPAALEETVRSFNADARRGIDTQFGRGSDIYQRHLGDAERRPNPCMAPIEQAPYYAVAVRPADLGMAAGLVTDKWARVLDARGEAIPCVITGQADEFGGEIPVGPFAIIGDESIGEGIVATLAGHRSRAVLMQNHGVFTIGSSPRDAVKAAVMAEDVARTVHIARQLGEVIPIPPDSIDALFDRYQNVYGQKDTE